MPVLVMPVDLVLLERALDSAPQLLRRSRVEAIEDRRFAEAVYRAAIADGIKSGNDPRDSFLHWLGIDAIYH
jgi:hypothetical protein